MSIVWRNKKSFFLKLFFFCFIYWDTFFNASRLAFLNFSRFSTFFQIIKKLITIPDKHSVQSERQYFIRDRRFRQNSFFFLVAGRGFPSWQGTMWSEYLWGVQYSGTCHPVVSLSLSFSLFPFVSRLHFAICLSKPSQKFISVPRASLARNASTASSRVSTVHLTFLRRNPWRDIFSLCVFRGVEPRRRAGYSSQLGVLIRHPFKKRVSQTSRDTLLRIPLKRFIKYAWNARFEKCHVKQSALKSEAAK